MANCIPAHMINEVIGCRQNVIEPKVGMLGTYFVGSDRYAIVVCKVYSPKKIFIQHLRAYDEKDIPKKVIDGVQYWEGDADQLMNDNCPDLSDPDFEWESARFWKEGTYTLRKNGRWIEQGRGLWECGSIHLGVADPYQDPCF